jgi:lysozyme
MLVCKEAVDLVRFAECAGGKPNLKAYKCPAGVLTIGFGHTGRDVKEGMTCTVEQAHAWLMNDLAAAANAVDQLIAVPLSANQRGALASFVFNLGQGALRGSTLRRKLNAGDYAGAAAEFGRWTKALVDGETVSLSGLVKRRAAESTLFLS